MSIIPGIENLAPERTLTSSGSVGIAEAAAHLRLELGDLGGDLVVEAGRPARLHVGPAGVGGDREARRHRQLQHAGHLGQVGALAAEEVLVLHRRAAVLVVEGVDVGRSGGRHGARVYERERTAASGPTYRAASRPCRPVRSSGLMRVLGFPVHVRPGFLFFMVLIVGAVPRRVRPVAGRRHRRVHAAPRARPRRGRPTGRRHGRDLARLPGRLRLVHARPSRSPTATEAAIALAGPVTHITSSLLVLYAMGVDPFDAFSRGSTDAAGRGLVGRARDRRVQPDPGAAARRRQRRDVAARPRRPGRARPFMVYASVAAHDRRRRRCSPFSAQLRGFVVFVGLLLVMQLQMLFEERSEHAVSPFDKAMAALRAGRRVQGPPARHQRAAPARRRAARPADDRRRRAAPAARPCSPARSRTAIRGTSTC